MNMVWKKKWCAGAGGALFLLLVSVGLILVAYLEHEEDPSLQVITRHGKIKGRSITTREGKHVLAFTGIPYAKPPIGDLRFREPQSLHRWEAVLDATKDAPSCTQRNILAKGSQVSGQEDCLYINVYTPHIEGQHLLDVMVFIHGGGWFSGSGSDYDLPTGDSVCPGNNGLKDQVAALKWVRDNIAAFGGNPGSVTIFGGSAGGASVHYHILSPASRALINCLRKKEAVEITGTDNDFMEWSIHPAIPFKPVVEKGDNAFLPATPLELAKNLTNTVPWITGIAPGDGIIAVASKKENLCIDVLMLTIWLLLFLCTSVYGQNDPLEVTIQQGKLKGFRLLSRKGKEFFGFQRIPYAKSPIGDLRFQKPQPLEKWDGVLDATQDPPKCTQRNIYRKEKGVSGQEDCLYINVYTPHIQGPHLLDVMVYIHGGGWLAGAGSNHNPSYLIDKNVVLVTFNYRLGPLGFLSTGDSACPGNNGLKDQVAALKWIQDNIRAFGGNPDSVTIFGESAGGASVHYLMLSPTSKGLFHRAISQSGTALCSWSLAPHGSTTSKAKKLATLLGCPTQSSSALIDCLRKKEATEITGTDKEFMEWSIHPVIPFKPVVETGEDSFLPATPMELAKNATNTIPWMTGVTSGEGAFVASMVETGEDAFLTARPLELVKNISNTIPWMTGINSGEGGLVASRIFGDGLVSNLDENFEELFTDAWFLHGADQAVRLHSEMGSAPIYYYYFTYRGSRSLSTVFGDSTRDYGVCHADELLYLFDSDKLFPNSRPTKEDEFVTELMTTLWANFAHNGNPTPTPYKGVIWPQVSNPSKAEYVQIHKDGIHTKNGLLKKRVKFWDSLPLQFESTRAGRDEL
ncbi:hypothetical protein C0J52_03840 [Blattella germanica]|nr:hypothetical protein C0J52_03840 [Blattella germanica]